MDSDTVESGIFSIHTNDSVDSTYSNNDANIIQGNQNHESEQNDFLSTWNRHKHLIISRNDKKNHRLNRNSFRRQSRRMVQKNGYETELTNTNVPLRHIRYFRDLSNTIVDSRWRWIISLLVFTYAFLWFLFAWLWMVIATVHGDIEHPFANDTCIFGCRTFTEFLIMSVETQTTIGGGSRYPTENCPEGAFLLCVQVIMGTGIEGAILGMFYIKMTRPFRRNSNKLFSKNMVVCQRDGDLCLMFRVNDKRKAHIMNTKIEVYFTEIKKYTKKDHGDSFEYHQTQLEIEPFGLLCWPLTILHKITPTSPFYNISAKDLLFKNFEIIVVLLGYSESTSQLAQSRTSYLPSNIYWGYRFKPCVSYDDGDDKHCYVVHSELLDAIEQIDTPLCSAQRLTEVINIIQDESNRISVSSSSPSTIRNLSLPSSATVSPITSSPHYRNRSLNHVLETEF